MVIQRVNTVDIPEDEGDFTSPENHKNSLRYYEFKGFAWFTCREQHEPDSPDIKIRRWASARSWCFIDLKKQEICYRDTQECKVDNIVAQPGPEFTEEVIQRWPNGWSRGFCLRLGGYSTFREIAQTQIKLKVDHMMKGGVESVSDWEGVAVSSNTMES